MSRELVLDLSLKMDRFSLAVRWQTAEAALGIFGPSGAGKTTLLEVIAGLRRGARGVIRLGTDTWLDTSRGVCLPPERRGVGYVPQDALLFPHLDVMANILAGRRRAGRDAARRVAPERVLEILELTGFAGRPVGSLSGGEKQRVALGRALCSAPALLLLDEPLAGLDRPLRRRILSYLYRVQGEFGIPTLHVSHDAAEVAMIAREVAVLAAGQVVARGRPEEVLTGPAVLPMARADGFENVLHGQVIEAAAASAAVELAPGTRVTVAGVGLETGREAMIAARAEDLILAVQAPIGLSAQNILPGTIREIREPAAGDLPAGQVVAFVTLGGLATPIVVAITPQARLQLGLRPGLEVHVVCKANAFTVLATR
jgi:molybdate transport system ATP-binding protein